MFVKICLQLFCLLKNLFFENEKTPKELFVCVSWVVGKADTEETCSAMLYKHLLQPVNSDKSWIWSSSDDWLHSFNTSRLHSRHSVLCGSKSLTYWQDRRQNEPPRGLMRMVDRAYCPWSGFALGLCFLASTSGTLCIVHALSSIEVKLHYSVII